MRLLNHAGLIKLNRPASKQKKKKKKIQNFKLFGFQSENSSEICILPPVVELRITLSYITQQSSLVA